MSEYENSNQSAGTQAYADEPAAKPKKKKNHTALKVILVILVCAILATMIGIGGKTIYDEYVPEVRQGGIGAIFDGKDKVPDERQETDQNAKPQEDDAKEDEPAATATPAPVKQSNENSQEENTITSRTVLAKESSAMSYADIYDSNVNSTVGITTSVTVNYWGYPAQLPVSGSGFIVSKDGYILTNYHVIEDSNSVTVTTYDGKSYDASVIGYDQTNDIAVLKIDAKDLKPVTLGDSSELRVGDEVLAIGNPLGELTFSMTRGIVSALGRSVTLSKNITMKLIQTDCSINSGNSGGALFNMDGEVVGITNAKYSSNGTSEASIDNIGFAIPINSVQKIVASIIENGYILKPYIGVTVDSVSSETMSIAGIEAGAWVKDVSSGSPAEDAGLQVNDVITAVNGDKITSSSDLVEMIQNTKPGDEIALSVYRQGKELNLSVVIGSKTQSALPDAEAAESDAQQSEQNQNGAIIPQQPDGGQQNGSQNDMEQFYNYYFGNGGNSGNAEEFFKYFFNN